MSTNSHTGPLRPVARGATASCCAAALASLSARFRHTITASASLTCARGKHPAQQLALRKTKEMSPLYAGAEDLEGFVLQERMTEQSRTCLRTERQKARSDIHCCSLLPQKCNKNRRQILQTKLTAHRRLQRAAFFGATVRAGIGRRCGCGGGFRILWRSGGRFRILCGGGCLRLFRLRLFGICAVLRRVWW